MHSRLRSSLLVTACFVGGLGLFACHPTSHGVLTPGFLRWCGERPCGWQVQGQVERVGTWQADDYALSLVSDHAQVSFDDHDAQPDPRSADAQPCIHLSVLTKLDPGVWVFAELDFDADGVADFRQRLSTGDYHYVDIDVLPPTWFRGIRFTLRKDGPGLAIVAARSWQNPACQGVDTVPLDHRPDGAPCEAASQCSTGACTDGLCGACGLGCACADGGVGCVCGADAAALTCACSDDGGC